MKNRPTKNTKISIQRRLIPTFKNDLYNNIEMYQAIPSLPQYASVKEEESQEGPVSGSKWLKIGAAAGAVGLVGLVAFNSFTKGIGLSRHETTMAEDATKSFTVSSTSVFSYSAQSEEVKLASFEDFIFKYGRTVRISST
jgi:hypothetical protein